MAAQDVSCLPLSLSLPPVLPIRPSGRRAQQPAKGLSRRHAQSHEGAYGRQALRQKLLFLDDRHTRIRNQR